MKCSRNNDHVWQGVWLTDDLEGFRCKNCGKEVLDPPDRIIVIDIDYLKQMENELKILENIVDTLILYYWTGFLPVTDMPKLDENIDKYRKMKGK